ncbi:hypothetical protein [Enterococcus sp. S86.2]|uniref:hypothetical protein n=1 Tax=Enterococcus sp. S86.2 TaxID=3031299 RepID=UPI0026EE62E9|nr:hypothetical protein [Enterococcus sp. S86.2]
MIKFKEFNTQPYDVHISAFFQDENKKYPEDAFEYVDLKAIDRKLVILVYRQTNINLRQLKAMSEPVLTSGC